MKKYLPGIFAIVLAIGFSAYTKNAEIKPPTGATFTPLYWYEIWGPFYGPLIEDHMYESWRVRANGPHPLTECDGFIHYPCIVGAETNDKYGAYLPTLTFDNAVFIW